MIYHAGLTTKIVLAYAKLYPKNKLKVLVSFGRRGINNDQLLFEHRDLVAGVACDSGTWTLNQNPQKNAGRINFSGYTAYLKIFAPKFDFYFNFDKDFSRDAFDQNFFYQLELEKQGLRPIPVIHDCYGEEVGYYIDRGDEMVAIGSSELRDSDVHELYRIVEKFSSKGIKVHLLGCTDYEKLAYLPVYSCDSSTWTQSARRDYILFWNQFKEGIDKKDVIEFYDEPRLKNMGRHYKNYEYRWDLEQYLEDELGFELDDLVGSQNAFNREIAVVHYFVQLERRILDQHKALGYLF